MKNNYILANVIALFIGTTAIAQVGISNATSFTPDTYSILDASSTTKGVLLPRVALTSTTTLTPITGTATAPESLFVYNTASGGTSPNNVTPGFYFWTGTKWNRVLNSNNEAKPMVFYAPSIVLPTASGNHTVDLYLEYKNQFGTPKYSSNVDEPLTTYTVGQLAYFITYIDETVFTNTNLAVDGKLTYTIPATANITEKTFINVVFKVRN